MLYFALRIMFYHVKIACHQQVGKKFDLKKTMHEGEEPLQP